MSGFCFQISGVSDDEAVRIFLEFERVESAIKGEQLKDKFEEGVCVGGLYFKRPRSCLINQVSV